MDAYEQTCRDTVTRLGLDPIVERLAAEGIGHTVEQTGGFTMVVTVPVKDATMAITHDGTVMVGFHPGNSWQQSHEEIWVEFTNLDGMVELIEVYRS
jgi:hypothetical protein